jgi:diacylglycerol kinase family enzyme
MRALLVVNPAATTTSARTREVLASALETDLKLEVAHTRHRGHAAELAAEARADGLDLVVVLGGDGTVNEVVNGLLGGVDATDVPDVPDLASCREAARTSSAGPSGCPRPGRGHRRPAGRAARAPPPQHRARPGRRALVHLQRRDGLGRRGGGPGRPAPPVPADPAAAHDTTDYVRAAVSQFFLHTDRRTPAITLEVPGAEPQPVHMAIVANTAPWTYLGDRPLLTSPEASFDTGLDLYALTRLRTVGTLSEARRLLRGRPTPSRRGPRTLVHRQHDLAELTLRASHPVAAQADGEALGDIQR